MGRSKTKWNDLILNWNEKFYQKKFYEKFQQKYFIFLRIKFFKNIKIFVLLKC